MTEIKTVALIAIVAVLISLAASDPLSNWKAIREESEQEFSSTSPLTGDKELYVSALSMAGRN